MKRYCHNSRTSYDVDMKLALVTKLGIRNKATSKKFEDEVISRNCDLIAMFPIYGRFGAIGKPGSGVIVCKTYISIKSNLLSYKN